jgi:hypothetical protein
MLPDKPIPINSAEALLNLVNGCNPFTVLSSRYKCTCTYYNSDSNTIHLAFTDKKDNAFFTNVTTTGQLSMYLNSFNLSCLVPKLEVVVNTEDGLFANLDLYYAGYYQTSNPKAYVLSLVTSKELVDDERFAATLSNR